MTELRAPRVRELFIGMAQRFEEQRALEERARRVP
jgi:hypothetical protein